MTAQAIALRADGLTSPQIGARLGYPAGRVDNLFAKARKRGIDVPPAARRSTAPPVAGRAPAPGTRLAEMIALRAGGMDNAAIGERLSCTTAEVVSAFSSARGRGVAVPAAPDVAAGSGATGSAAKTRACLLCGKRFRSWGAGNRVCEPCKRGSAWSSGIAE